MGLDYVCGWPLSEVERTRLLSRAYDAVRRGRLDEVQALLNQLGDRAASDAACLNLFGVVCEARGESKSAKRYYGRAIRADRRFAAAQQNMRRLYELDTLGSSTQPVAVGEALTDLWLARPRTILRAAR